MVTDSESGGGTAAAPGGFGYVPEVLPEAAQNFHVRERGLKAQALVRKVWKTGAVLDQKANPSCVGFAWTHELMARPSHDLDVEQSVASRYALNHYYRSVYLWYTGNGWSPDSIPYDQGSSNQAGAQVALARGFIDEYQWAETMDDIRDAVIGVGPVVLGINWFNSMHRVDERGRVRVDTSGRSFGHAVMVNGYDPKAPILRGGRTASAFRLRNSWGTGWGKGKTGEAWITEGELAKVFNSRSNGGAWSDAACLPIGRNAVDLATVLAANPDRTTS